MNDFKQKINESMKTFPKFQLIIVLTELDNCFNKYENQRILCKINVHVNALQ